MTLKELYNKNKLIEVVQKDNQIILKREFELNPKLKKGRKINLSNRERFIINTFYYMTEALSKIETIDYYPVFLNSYPKTKLWNRTFGRVDYIKYHTENYLNNIVGIFDRCLLLVNFLYNLGFRDKDVRYHLIISNNHIKREPIERDLESFDNSLKNIKLLCNLTKHRGRFSDKNLDKIGQYEFILRNSKTISKKEKNLFKFFVKFKLSSYLSENKRKAKKNNETIIKFCDRLFNDLTNKYKERLNSFNKNASNNRA